MYVSYAQFYDKIVYVKISTHLILLLSVRVFAAPNYLSVLAMTAETKIITIDSNLTFLPQKIANKMPFECKPWCNAERFCDPTETGPIYFHSPLVFYDDINEYFSTNNKTLPGRMTCFVYKHYNMNKCKNASENNNVAVKSPDECTILKRIENNLKTINVNNVIVIANKEDDKSQYILCENNCDWDVIAETLAAIITAHIMKNRLVTEETLLQILRNESQPQKAISTKIPLYINPFKIVEANNKKNIKDDCMSCLFYLEFED